MHIFFRTSLTLLVLVAILITPRPVSAEFLEVSAPAEIYLETAFEIDITVSAEKDTIYHLKARLGQSGSNLSKGQTFDISNGVWLSDTVSWNKFPSFQTNSDGSWVGKLKVKSSATAVVGDNLLQVRIQKEGSSDKYDSPAYTVKLLKTNPQIIENPVTKPVPKLEGKPVLSEFMAQPLNKIEWVEIRNDGTTPADISGWKLDDQEGKSSPQIIADGTIIQPKGYFVLDFQSYKLNDLSDSVRLLKPDDSVVESFTYEKTVKGQSWAKDNSSKWFITSDPTPNSENKFIYISETPNPTTTPNQAQNSSSENAILAATNQTAVTTLPVLSKPSKLATVSSSFVNKQNKNNFSNLILYFAGGILIVSSIAIVFKQPILKRLQKEKAALPK